MKSANARSSVTPPNMPLFSEFTCNLKLTPSTKLPTQEMNPDKIALKGKDPIIRAYRNCVAPVNKTYIKLSLIHI